MTRHPAPSPAPTDFALRGDHITLDALLKACGLAASGGDAKGLIASGAVQVNGQPETRRGRKLRPGDEVGAVGQRVRVQAGVSPTDAPADAPIDSPIVEPPLSGPDPTGADPRSPKRD